MISQDLYPMLLGAVAMGSFVATLFFLRFWAQTRDPLFLFFAAAFALDAVTRVALSLRHPNDEMEPFYYLARLVTFALIIAAIVHKNRPRSG
jgi:uncharacterized membrane protein HdeD (DUF308 family)